MRALSQEEDPNEEHVQTDGTVSMPKRGLIDSFPKALTIDVTTASNVATANVLPAMRVHGVLQIEITQPNLDLLLEEPTAESTHGHKRLSMRMCIGLQVETWFFALCGTVTNRKKGHQVYRCGV